MDKYNKHRFRLISPVVGNKIYSSSSLKHVARKCIDELRNNIQIGGKKYSNFAILDIDNYTTYKFNLNHHSSHRNHNLPSTGSILNQVGGGDELYIKVGKLEDRIKNIESMIQQFKIENLKQIEGTDNVHQDEINQHNNVGQSGGNNFDSINKENVIKSYHSEQPYLSNTN